MHRRQPIQIHIPQPCKEDWNKMSPAEQGRYCNSCQKCVVDFTNHTDVQLYNYIKKHRNEDICGRFHITQVNRNLVIPYQPKSRLYRYFVSVGLTLLLTQMPNKISYAKAPFACSNSFDAQDTTKPASGLVKTRDFVIQPRVIKLDPKPITYIGAISLDASVEELIREIIKTDTLKGMFQGPKKNKKHRTNNYAPSKGRH